MILSSQVWQTDSATEFSYKNNPSKILERGISRT